MSKILIVEDDEMTRNVIVQLMKMEKHAAEGVADGDTALEYMRGSDYDLVIIDWGIPGLTGLDLCHQYRALGGKALVLMLTGRNAPLDKVAGLDSGADDYLTKPCDMRELAARVRALLRRIGASEQVSDVLTVGDISLDRKLFKVTRAGKQVDLIAKEFAILELFMRSPGGVFSPDAILDRVWTTDDIGSAETLRTHIKNLRKKLNVEGIPDPIKTIHGVGYKLDLS